MMAYAYILTTYGYPCVFWKDYFNYDLAQSNNKSGIDALIYVHENYAVGNKSILYVDDDLYIMQRKDDKSNNGLIFVLNNKGTWNGTIVDTGWSGAKFKPVAWRGYNDANIPNQTFTDGNMKGQFWAPPRGYVVYAPVWISIEVIPN